MELCTCPADSVCSWNLREKLKDELIRGHELANQLHFAVDNGDGGSADGLVTKIESTFTTCISLLSGNHQSKGELIQVNTVAPPIVDSSCRWGALEAINSTEMFVDHGGSSQRTKTSRSWSRDTPDFVDDGHAWRKYGQKEILNARHPRSYFRCSHKYDQGCKATKQVQKVEDDPTLFRTTYFGNHTCKHNLLNAHELILDSISSGNPREQSTNSKFTVSFENTNNSAYKQSLFSSYLATEREISNSIHVASNQPSSSSFDYRTLDHQAVLEPSEPINGLPKMMELGYEEFVVYYKKTMASFDQQSFPI